MKELRKQLNSQRRIDTALPQQIHRRTQNADHFSGMIVTRNRHQVGQRSVQFVGETRHEILECQLDSIRQNVLRLKGKRTHVPIGLEEMQQLAGVRQPEGL